MLENVAGKPNLRFVILDLEGINQIDATGEEVIGNLRERLETAGIIILVARPKAQTTQILERSGMKQRIGESHFFRTRTDAIRYAREQLGDEAVADSPLNPDNSVRQARVATA